ncbi:MAG: AAA family ATPase [Prevotella sp.]|jgi:predicted ATPase|nr:AAA family ATPase [Prevotella sp.]
MKKNFYIITGGPGAGKTTLLEELQRRGYKCIPEVARNIIKDQIDNGGDALPWMDAEKYSELMLLHSISDFEKYKDERDTVFFDRGIPDTYGYEQLMNFEYNEKLVAAVSQYRYNLMVFILPPWEYIYQTDNERKQNFKTAIETYQVMLSVYKRLGYKPVHVPCLSETNRADFVENRITL